MEIVEIQEYSTEVLEALNLLMPQLSPSFGPLTREDLVAIIESNASTLYMAVESSQYYGSLTLVRFKTPSGYRAWIEDVVVSDKARGRGVGQRLVEHAVGVANDGGVQSIDLTARDSRVAAVSLYKKVGFRDRATTVYRLID